MRNQRGPEILVWFLWMLQNQNMLGRRKFLDLRADAKILNLQASGAVCSGDRHPLTLQHNPSFSKGSDDPVTQKLNAKSASKVAHLASQINI